MKETAAVLVIIISLIGHAPYLIKTIRGHIQPNPISWLIWAIASTVMLILVATSGGGIATWSLYVGVAIQIAVCFFAFRHIKKHSITRFDIVSFCAATIGLAIWILADDSQKLA